MSEMLTESGSLPGTAELAAIGRRIVHGGEAFHEPVRIDDTVLADIEQQIPMVPLHNPANIAGLRVAMKQAPGIPHRLRFLIPPFTRPCLNTLIFTGFHTAYTGTFTCGGTVFGE